MKRNVLIVAGLIAISVFLFSAKSAISPTLNALPKKEIEIALRNIGHQTLLHAGDSVSRVLPVNRITETVYSITFQTPFTFVPDSLVKIARQSLAATSVTQAYTVHVVDCSSRSVVYGFKVGIKEETLVPCLGREQPIGCYEIQISFLAEPQNAAHKGWLAFLALGSLAMLGYVGRAFAKNKKQTISSTDLVAVGLYQFSEEKRILIYSGKVTELSDKETQLLKVLLAHRSEPVSRSILMKEVWNDDGALISRSLDVFVSRLRKKLKDDAAIQILNVHGFGYKLVIPL